MNTNLQDVQAKCEDFSNHGGEFMESTMNVGKTKGTISGPGAQGGDAFGNHG